MRRVRCEINGAEAKVDVEPRELLLDVLRDRLGLTGVHGGCEHGACGACTVLVDGASVRSCLMFAVQADGCAVTTIEGVSEPGGELHPVQQALADHHGLQCGFCTPGMVLASLELLERDPAPSRDSIERALSGNLCRCTGYAGIVDAVEAASRTTSGPEALT